MVGLLVGVVVDGEELGIVVIVGSNVGFLDLDGFKLGRLEDVGENEGEAEGATPHSTESKHGMQTSMSRIRILALFGLVDLNPPIHWQRGLKAFPPSPTAWAR